MGKPDRPLFDSSRAALVFALNATGPGMPRPFMNKAMSESRGSSNAVRDGDFSETKPKPTQKLTGMSGLGGMDKVAQAGLILRQLARLPFEQQSVLMGLLTQSRTPCACRSPCCQGWRAKPSWSVAVFNTCYFLRDEAAQARTPGKKGVSTHPGLRQSLVEQFFTCVPKSLIDMAMEFDLTSMTVAKHRAIIMGRLNEIEREAWAGIHPLLDAAGITGSLE